jgi:hypothetical protein
MRQRRPINGPHHIDPQGRDVWDNLMYNEVRYEEMEIGLTVFIG